MTNCMRLKEARKNAGLSQVDLAHKVNLSPYTIVKLEKDETQWAIMAPMTADKIQGFLDEAAAEQLNKNKEIKAVKEKPQKETVEEIKVVEDVVIEPEKKVVHKTTKKQNGLTELDGKTLTLVEFAYDGLKESKTHEDFMANIGLLKRILSKY